jgi:type II secretory pathway pseudopilin PulG
MSVVLILVGIVATICFYPLVAYNKKEEEIKLQRGEVPDF